MLSIFLLIASIVIILLVLFFTLHFRGRPSRNIQESSSQVIDDFRWVIDALQRQKPIIVQNLVEKMEQEKVHDEEFNDFFEEEIQKLDDVEIINTFFVPNKEPEEDDGNTVLVDLPEKDLTNEERERRRKNNLCMFCGGQHMVKDCRKREAAHGPPQARRADASGSSSSNVANAPSGSAQSSEKA